MDRSIFERFFSIGHVSIGPTIISPIHDGNWLGSVQVHSNTEDIFLERKFTVVGVREFNNTITIDLFNALNYLSIDKTEFDRFINQIYLYEWESTTISPKPDVSNLKIRAYI
jgi:hypothetical protein